MSAGLFAALTATPLPATGQDNETCFACHASAVEETRAVKPEDYGKSIHGEDLCISCHTDITEVPHPAKLAPVSCDNCHRLETKVYLNSDHGQSLSHGITEAATCTSCHGKTHTLLSSRNPKSPVHRKNLARTCAVCHADTKKMAEFRLSQTQPFDTYRHSVHGEAFRDGKTDAAICSDCHGTHNMHAASNPQSKVFRSNVPATCAKCHENVASVFKRSVHGAAVEAGMREAPVCTDCHGEHTIRHIWDPASSVYKGAITKTCSACHASERIVAKFGLPQDRLTTFQDSYHGLAGRMGDLHAANCASCHGWHDTLPSSDPLSSIHSENLGKTCGKCHTGAHAGKVNGNIHGTSHREGKLIIRVVWLLYLILIPVTIGGMLIHNFSDYLRKAYSLATGGKRSSHDNTEEIMNFNERIQHAFLLTTFTVLAYSGFALKYPEAWWAIPFQMAGGEMMRKAVHRWTALVFVLAGAYHTWYMLGTKRGRELLFDRFFPRLRDLTDPIAKLAYNLGFRKQEPELPHTSYIEKAEYWALVWGSFVMIATGALLVFNDWTMKYFPLWVSNLATMIHFLEAVLACLAVLVWHSYWTVFDPYIYPMNWVWLSGRRTLKNRGQ